MSLDLVDIRGSQLGADHLKPDLSKALDLVRLAHLEKLNSYLSGEMDSHTAVQQIGSEALYGLNRPVIVQVEVALVLACCQDESAEIPAPREEKEERHSDDLASGPQPEEALVRKPWISNRALEWVHLSAEPQ